RSAEYLNFCKAVDSRQKREFLLVPLPIAAIDRLLCQEIPSENSPMTHDTLVTIAEVSQGNPFLLWKIIKYAQESNIDNINSVALSIRDNSLIIFILDDVSETQRVIVKAAAVIGETFDVTILEEVVPRNTRLLVESYCQSLVRKGLLLELSSGMYSFSSSLVRKFVYDLVPQSDAKRLHGLIAEAIAFKYRDSLSEQIFSLSYHYSESCDDAHQSLAFRYSCRSVQSLCQDGMYLLILPYVEAAWNSAVSRSERRSLRRILESTYHSLRQILPTGDETCDSLHMIRDSLQDILQILCNDWSFRSAVKYILVSVGNLLLSARSGKVHTMNQA
ncbi:unnamed protein product, partial [Symbiodinium microadriaticum]